MREAPGIEGLKNLIAQSQNIVFFGGAGVSTESNIPDFRSASGLYQQGGTALPPEKMLHIDFFMEKPADFFAYYFANMVHAEAKPNAAHTALAALEQQGKLKAVITQNVDGLHQQAGSRKVIELHGTVHRNFCMDCRAPHTLADVLASAPKIPHCKTCGGIVKPDVTLYGEQLPVGAFEEAEAYVQAADVLIIGGTSLSVYPAAGLVRYYQGENMVLINQDATAHDHLAQWVFRDKIGEVLRACVKGSRSL